MRLLLLCLVALGDWARPDVKSKVEVRESEIWLTEDGQANELTHDGRPKYGAALSGTKNQIAYVEQCLGNCAPSVVILDRTGHKRKALQPKLTRSQPSEPCTSIDTISWAAENVIAVDCHLNPSLGEYVETNIVTGQTVRDLLGFGFTRSPSGTMVAHVGQIIHFAPPYAKSQDLQIENTTIYPHPKGTTPEIAPKRATTYYGIHEFDPRIAWSPDSQHLALIDCTYNWTPNHLESLSEDGTQSGQQCSLVVVSPTGKVSLRITLPKTALPHADEPHLSWRGRRTLSLGKRQFRLP